jgi:hypothetical protein
VRGLAAVSKRWVIRHDPEVVVFMGARPATLHQKRWSLAGTEPVRGLAAVSKRWGIKLTVGSQRGCVMNSGTPAVPQQWLDSFSHCCGSPLL